MNRHPTFCQQFIVQRRVLGIRRAVMDSAYLLWVISLNCGFGIPFRFWGMLGLTGWRGYFDWRDSVEFPQIDRWQRRWFSRWQMQQAARAAKEG